MSSVNKLAKINQWGIAAVLLTPLWLGQNFIFPFVQLKNIYFRSLVLLIFISTVWYILERGQIAKKRNWLLTSVGIFLLAQSLAGIFGVNFSHSLYGNWERMDGLINLFLVGIFFFIIAVNFRQLSDWSKIFRAHSLIVVALVLLSLWQHGFNLAHNNWSSIGNSSFLGYYLLLSVGLTLFAFFIDQNKTWHWIYGATVIIELAALLGASSRAPILGLLFGSFIGGVIHFRDSNKQFKKIFLASIAVMIVLIGLSSWQKDSLWVKNIHFLDRIVHISRADNTTSNRLLVWQSGLESFMDRPWLGYGPENVQVGINKHYNPLISEQWFDRAHNFIVDYLNASGVVGLAAYAIIWLAMIVSAWSLKRKKSDLGSLALGLIAANLFCLLFVFDTINTWLVLAINLSLIYWLQFRFSDIEMEAKKPWWLEKGYYLILGATVLVVVVVAYVGVVKSVRANYITAEALKYSQVDPTRSLALYDQALDINSLGDREIRLQMLRYAYEAIIAPEADLATKKAIFERSEEAALEYLNTHDYDIQMRLALAQCYLAYVNINTFYSGETIRLLENNMADSPKRLEIYFMLAQAYYEQNDFSTAVVYLERALAVGEENETAYENLLNIYSQTGEKEKFLAIAARYEAKFGNLEAEAWRKLGEYYFRLGESENARRVLLEKAIPAEPDSWRSYVSCASIYEADGQIEQAINYLESVLAEHPEFEDIFADYLQALRQKQ